MKLKGISAVLCLLSLLFGSSFAFAQEETDEEPAAAPDSTQEDGEKKKKKWALYAMTGGGSVTADEINTSIDTSGSGFSNNLLDLEDQFHMRAGVGWQLADGKGDIRLIFNGYKEDGYVFDAVGLLAEIPGVPPQKVADPMPWFNIHAETGHFRLERTTPHWAPAIFDESQDPPVLIDPGNDTNLDGQAQVNELDPLLTVVDLTIERSINDDLQNRAQTYDVVYGRTWGKRRFSGRWWGGVRYFEYAGNLPAAAWVGTSGGTPGTGYTDGTALRLLTLRQDTTGFGPTGTLEANWGFFDQRLSLYLQGQAAFMLLDLELDTGAFVTTVEDTNGTVVPVQGRLIDHRNKSAWQDRFEAGARLTLKSGVEIEVGYSITGFLDALLIPTSIRVPQVPNEASAGTSALFNTRDYILDGFHATVGYQF
ncbi:MAG: hypothetical protein GY716_20370 [bacterium]|nr:hypothetical protein [bacterium]